MRKHQQKQILELLQTIKQAQSAGLYADSQEGALSVGNFIEYIEGEGTQTVSLLVDYCEMLFKASIGEINEKPLLKQLTAIEDSVKRELRPNKIEIAFLSYNASMSDALESIYLAAKADPNCDAYWIPIPYYERNPDGSVGRMHYEDSSCYNDSFECTDWREYDIEARHPDVIFTFSPYDAGNYVTTVHPSFYCERLRELTDLLVYVPYFVAVDDIQKDMEHFCICAGCAFAHKVILQSERIRDTYTRVFKEKYDSRFGKPKDKFIALGSPKYDKIINSKREEYELPDEWLRLIEGKKIILYNTSLGAALQWNEQYLKKLSYVLEIFRNRDDVVLWWRPHPLMAVTYSSMRPQLYARYEAIVKEFKRGTWGVYDDTPDIHRAITCSDAYYGDWSSVVSMYQATGKPVMIGNIEKLQNEYRFFPVSLYVDETDIWISVKRINALFKMSKSDWEPEFIGRFPHEMEFAARFDASLYLKPAEKNGVIYFPPFQAKEIAAYSVADNRFMKFAYKKSGDEEAYQRDFASAVAYGDYVYFTPYLYPAILRLDTVTHEITYYSEWVGSLRNLMSDTKEAYFLHPIVVGKSIFLAACGANAVVEFNMETCESVVYTVGERGYRFNGICFDGENFWISPRQSTETPVIKWNPQTCLYKEFKDIYQDDTRQYWYLPIIYGGGFVWLLPLLSKHVYKIDTCTDVISIAEEFELRLSNDRDTIKTRKYSCAQSFGDSIFTYNELAGTFIEYNFTTKERREEKVSYSEEAMAQISPLLAEAFLPDIDAIKFELDCYYEESNEIGLSGFLNHISKDPSKTDAIQSKRIEVFKQKNKNSDGTAGQAIFNFVKNAILG